MAKKSDKTDNGNSLVLVDLAELSRGLKTTFMGVATVFGSLGNADANAEIATALSDAVMPTAVTSEKPIEEAAEDKPTQDKPDETHEPHEPAEAAEPDTPTATAPSVDDELPFKEEADTASTTPAVTVDDITKVIVAKIKQKRSNNAKIGALLKTYGVDKVSSLPPEKYEAFLTDISQL